MSHRLSWILASAMLAFSAHAQPTVQVHPSGAWIRLLPAGLPAGAYVTLHNDAARPTLLTGAGTPRYAQVMLHQSSSEGGMARMAKVAKITIPAHGSAELTPGGYHLMLMQATSPVKVGEHIPITLTFADGSTLKVPFEVRPANAIGASDSDHLASPNGH